MNCASPCMATAYFAPLLSLFLCFRPRYFLLRLVVTSSVRRARGVTFVFWCTCFIAVQYEEKYATEKQFAFYEFVCSVNGLNVVDLHKKAHMNDSYESQRPLSFKRKTENVRICECVRLINCYSITLDEECKFKSSAYASSWVQNNMWDMFSIILL